MAFGIDDAVTSATKLIDDAINKIWPSATEKATAQATVIQATAMAALEQMRQSMSVMLAEAQSTDKWTSRARPSLLYVMYTLILAGVPFGFLAAFQPAIAHNVAGGMNQWLAAVPDILWQMMGFCYLGYTGGRSFEKIKGVTK